MPYPIPVLDAGYVELVESWGSDERVIEAARMSTGKGFLGWPQDEKLLAYLYNNKHATPFEMAGLIVEVKAPIFVFREWHRHRTQSYNEMSARYIPLPDEHYTPTIETIQARLTAAGSNKQAGAIVDNRPTDDHLSRWLKQLESAYQLSQSVYETGLLIGVPKELARLPVPVARYSRMRASASLRNWLAFLTLRMAPNAQWEIQEYARAVATLIEQKFPRTYALFEKEITQ